MHRSHRCHRALVVPGDGTTTPVTTRLEHYLVQTSDANRFMVSDTVARDPNDPARVIARFADTAQLSEGTVGQSGNAPGNIQLVIDDGRVFPGAAFDVIQSDPRRAQITFDNKPWEDLGTVMGVADVGGAARSIDGSANSSVGVVRTATAAVAPGHTDGPHPVAASYDGRTNDATYRFDDTGSSGLFLTVGKAASDRFTGSGPVPSTGATARLFTAATSSAFDGITTGSPRGAVSFELEPAPPTPPAAGGGGGGTTPTTTTSTRTTPTGTTPPPAVTPITTLPPRVRFLARVTLKRSGRSSRRKYSGRISSEGRGCRAGRRVVLEVRTRSGRTRSGRTSTFTRGDDTFSLRRKRITGGRVYAFVTERGGTAAFCRSGSSSRISG